MSSIKYAFLFFTVWAQAQITIKGKLTDPDKNEPIPFASIGHLNSNTAVLSDEKGSFNLVLKTAESNDTIKFYAIGYKELYLPIKDLKLDGVNELKLIQGSFDLEEVEVNAKKLYTKKLGITKYDKSNCSGFIDIGNNWKGVETAIRLSNSENKLLKVKDFSFYIIKNTLQDSLTFRLNFYSANKFYPTRNILKKSIIFKTAVKQGEVTLDLSSYNIAAYSDFYVGLECLMEKVSIADFCFAGENSEPSYVRESAFNKWKKIRGGGAAFNVTTFYSKKN